MLPTLLTLPVVGTTFHVSSTNGDDLLGDGSTASPWRSLSYAGRHTAAGSTLLLERNSTWLDEKLIIADAAGVTISSYGNTSLPLPLVQMGRPVAMETTCVSLHGVTHTTVRGLHLSGCSTGLAAIAARGATDLLVERMFIRDVRTPFARYTPANPDWAVGISLTGTIANVTLRNNVASRVDSFFHAGAAMAGLLISGNTVAQCSGNCYSLGTGSGLDMRDNVMLRDLSTRYFLYGTTDVIVGSLSGHNRMVNNDFNARGEYTGGPDGCAFDFETAASGASEPAAAGVGAQPQPRPSRAHRHTSPPHSPNPACPVSPTRPPPIGQGSSSRATPSTAAGVQA